MTRGALDRAQDVHEIGPWPSSRAVLDKTCLVLISFRVASQARCGQTVGIEGRAVKGIKMFVAVTLVAGVASLIGCRSGGNEEGSSANETSSVTEVADPKPLDGVAEALETEGYSISNRGPG